MFWKNLQQECLMNKLKSFVIALICFLLKYLKNRFKNWVLISLKWQFCLYFYFEELVNSINGLFEDKSAFKLNSQFGSDFIQNHLPVKHFLKIGLLLMLCFGSFMLNFHHQKTALFYDTNEVALKCWIRSYNELQIC